MGYAPRMHITAAVIASLVVMFVSLSGILFSSRVLGSWMQRNLTYLATFSGGVFLLVVYHLLGETLHESSSLALAAGAVLFGAALTQAFHHILPQTHHHHSVRHDHAHTHIDGRRVLISDAFHNIGDGVLLVAAFAVDWYIGIAAAIGIILHELVQEVSEFFVLKESGYSSSRALLLNLVSASTILIGVAIAAFLSSAEHIAVLFAGIAAGGFLTVLLQDLIPHAAHSIRSHGGTWKHVIAAVLGISLMFAIQTLLSHEETDDAKLSTSTTQTLT